MDLKIVTAVRKKNEVNNLIKVIAVDMQTQRKIHHVAFG